MLPSLRLFILREQQLHQLAAAVVEPLQLARLVARQRVGRDDRQRDGRVHVADDSIGQTLWVNLAPRDGLARRRARQTAGVRTRVGDLQEVVVAALVYAEHFLNLRLGLEHEVLRASAAEDEDGRLAAVLPPLVASAVDGAALGGEDERGRLVDVQRRVEGELVTLQSLRRHIHPDGRVAGARSVERHAVLVCGGEERLVLNPQLALTLQHILATEVVKFRRGHRALELLTLDEAAEEGVCVEEHRIVEEDVVDAYDLLFAQDDVRDGRVPLMERKPDAEVCVVVEVRPRRDDPVNEPRAHERDERRDAQAGGRQRAREREADRDVRLKHLPREELARLAQARRVVREKSLVHEVGHRLTALNRTRVDAPPGKMSAPLLLRHSPPDVMRSMVRDRNYSAAAAASPPSARVRRRRRRPMRRSSDSRTSTSRPRKLNRAPGSGTRPDSLMTSPAMVVKSSSSISRSNRRSIFPTSVEPSTS